VNQRTNSLLIPAKSGRVLKWMLWSKKGHPIRIVRIIHRTSKKKNKSFVSRSSSISSISNSIVSLASDALSTASSSSQKLASLIVKGREPREAAIANHYLDQVKYGMPGSDGTCESNYWRYTRNNHELLAIFCADKSNPLGTFRRVLILFTKFSLYLLLSVVLEGYQELDYAIAIIFPAVQIYSTILKWIGQCPYCTRNNTCLFTSQFLSKSILTYKALSSILTFISAVYLIHHVPHKGEYVQTLWICILLEQFLFFYFGFLNWVLVSRKGCCCLPQFYCPNGAHNCPTLCPENKFPAFSYWPLLSWYPVKLCLQCVELGDDTYIEDKEKFRTKYPHLIRIDDIEFNEDGTLRTNAISLSLQVVDGDVEKGLDNDSCGTINPVIETAVVTTQPGEIPASLPVAIASPPKL